MTPQHGWRKWIKMTFDRVAGSTMLVILAPLIALVALVVRLILGKPVLYRQERPGFRGRIFTLYKFRTMTEARDASGRQLTDAQRLTKLGRILRTVSLDEIPQLINVVRGELSLVGPRPLLPQYLDRYTAEQARRHDVIPGVTGWAQINGRNAISWEEKFDLDVWYVDHWSLGLDFKILVATIRSVLRREGISGRGEATMSEFLGSSRQHE